VESKVSFTIIELAYSRRFHFWAVLQQDIEHAYEVLIFRFEFFGGVPQKVLVDNLKAARIHHAQSGVALFHPPPCMAHTDIFCSLQGTFMSRFPDTSHCAWHFVLPFSGARRARQQRYAQLKRGTLYGCLLFWLQDIGFFPSVNSRFGARPPSFKGRKNGCLLRAEINLKIGADNGRLFSPLQCFVIAAHPSSSQVTKAANHINIR
jgi:hypothetical protein